MKNFPMKFSIFNAEKFLCIVHGQVFIMDCDIFKNFVFPYHGSPDLLFGVTFWHHEARRVMPNCDLRDRFVYPYLTRMVDSFFCTL